MERIKVFKVGRFSGESFVVFYEIEVLIGVEYFGIEKESRDFVGFKVFFMF